MRVIDFLTLHADIIGSQPDSCDSLNVLNKARLSLWPIGDWRGTLVYAQLNVYGKKNPCIYAPFPVETIKGAWVGNYCNPITVDSCGYFLIDNKDQFCQCCCPDKVSLIGTGKTNSIPFEIGNDGYFFGFSLSNKDSEGTARIDVTYIDMYGNELSQTITFDKAFKVYTLDNRARQITSIHKTSDPIILCSKDGKVLHKFHSNEIEPRYSQYQVSGCACSCIIVKAKRIYQPYTKFDLNDPLDLNPHAIELVITARKSIRPEEENSPVIYSQWIKLAKEFLEIELEDKYESYLTSGKTNLIPDTSNLSIC